MGPLLVVKQVVFLIRLGLAGWSLDKCIDGEQTHPHLGGNTSTNFMLMFAPVGSLAIFAHGGMSLANAASVAIVASAITALAFSM